MAEDFDDPKDIAPVAIQFLSLDSFQRIDRECEWKDDRYKYSIYKLNDVAGTIRIDIRKTDK